MMIIGLTGSIGAGKTTTAKIIERLGASVIDADRIVKEVMLPESEEWKEIIDYFGKEIVSVDNNINYQKLAEIVFSDKEKLEKLNNIVHPKVINIVRKKIEELEKNGYSLVIIDAALLFETDLKNLTDKTIVVTAPEDLRISRVENSRGLSADEIKRRSMFQLSDEEKTKLADYLIKNNGTLKDLEKETENFWYNIILKRKDSRGQGFKGSSEV